MLKMMQFTVQNSQFVNLFLFTFLKYLFQEGLCPLKKWKFMTRYIASVLLVYSF